MKTPAEKFNAAVGRQLRAEIAAVGSSIAAMARDIGVARSALDNYVTGKRAIPIPVVYAVCATIGTEPHLVLARAEERLRSDERSRAEAVVARDGVITPLHPRADVAGRRDNATEVAFDSRLTHKNDTDDLY